MATEAISGEKTGTFTAESLPVAIGSLLEMNNYRVTHDVHLHGAQIDLVAESKGDPFAPKLYIEATIEYVSTAKFGKDVTKFILIQRQSPGSVCLCVSSTGFTADVNERAAASGVTTLTYQQLFQRFEKFGEYAEHILADKPIGQLVATY
ncbi:hypothetical protein [Sphingomonas sp. Leaf343]|uniref:hypothetical protein n=1 Tax=Sphingomonas sp. Leaf343 TaxID=1736345 RepID=UPI0006FE97AE|nr:hypothetical protein [Sphingomonas sp. Leaf343]KQR81192.1 hypothetical protein ASG07_12035 [Sphingomonas sp. Leaf343]